MAMGMQPVFNTNVFLMHQEGHKLFLNMMQELKFTIKGDLDNVAITLQFHMRARSAEKGFLGFLSGWLQRS